MTSPQQQWGAISQLYALWLPSLGRIHFALDGVPREAPAPDLAPEEAVASLAEQLSTFIRAKRVQFAHVRAAFDGYRWWSIESSLLRRASFHRFVAAMLVQDVDGARAEIEGWWDPDVAPREMVELVDQVDDLPRFRELVRRQVRSARVRAGLAPDAFELPRN